MKNTVSSWNDLTDKPFCDGETITIDPATFVPEYSIEVEGISIISLTDKITNREDLIGSSMSGSIYGQNISLTFTGDEIIYDENGFIIAMIIYEDMELPIVVAAAAGSLPIEADLNLEIPYKGLYTFGEVLEVFDSMSLVKPLKKLDVKYLPNVPVPHFNLINFGIGDLKPTTGNMTLLSNLDGAELIKAAKEAGSVRITYIYDGQTISEVFNDMNENDGITTLYATHMDDVISIVVTSAGCFFAEATNVYVLNTPTSADVNKIISVNADGEFELSYETATQVSDDSEGNVYLTSTKFIGGGTGGGGSTGPTNILSGGLNFILKASSAAPSDPGDLIFQNSNGAEIGRLWKETGADVFNIRFGEYDSAKVLLHSGNIGEYAAPAYTYQNTEPTDGTTLANGKLLIVYE